MLVNDLCSPWNFVTVYGVLAIVSIYSLRYGFPECSMLINLSAALYAWGVVIGILGIIFVLFYSADFNRMCGYDIGFGLVLHLFPLWVVMTYAPAKHEVTSSWHTLTGAALLMGLPLLFLNTRRTYGAVPYGLFEIATPMLLVIFTYTKYR